MNEQNLGQPAVFSQPALVFGGLGNNMAIQGASSVGSVLQNLSPQVAALLPALIGQQQSTALNAAGSLLNHQLAGLMPSSLGTQMHNNSQTYSRGSRAGSSIQKGFRDRRGNKSRIDARFCAQRSPVCSTDSTGSTGTTDCGSKGLSPNPKEPRLELKLKVPANASSFTVEGLMAPAKEGNEEAAATEVATQPQPATENPVNSENPANPANPVNTEAETASTADPADPADPPAETVQLVLCDTLDTLDSVATVQPSAESAESQQPEQAEQAEAGRQPASHTESNENNDTDSSSHFQIAISHADSTLISV